LIKVHPEAAKERIGYVTLVMPEARNALKQYLELRRRKR